MLQKYDPGDGRVRVPTWMLQARSKDSANEIPAGAEREMCRTSGWWNSIACMFLIFVGTDSSSHIV